jgi:hypothetical protein
MTRAACALLLILVLRNLSAADITQLEELRVDCDTVIVGTVKSVSIRAGAPDVRRRWQVVIAVDELLKGAPFKTNEITLFIHSPSRDLDNSAEQAAGQKVVWGLKRSGDDITLLVAPFFRQQFNDADLKKLREALKDVQKK